MKTNYYAQSMSYERLIRIAFCCNRDSKKGADMSFMQNAIWAENGASCVKHLGSYEKQLDKVKKYLSKALIKLSKTKPYNKSREYFLDLNNKVKRAYGTSELIHIVSEALEKVIELKPMQ